MQLRDMHIDSSPCPSTELTNSVPFVLDGTVQPQPLPPFPVNFNRKNQCLLDKKDYTQEDERQLAFLQAQVMLDFFDGRSHQATRKRLRSHTRFEQHSLQMAALISTAIKATGRSIDLIFVTINLKDEEQQSQALQNMRDKVMIETGIKIGWAGVFVPRSGKLREKQRHVHAILANVELYGPAWQAINRFMDGRNKNFPRSCHMQWTFNLGGLVDYLEGKNNLRRRGAKVIRSDDIGKEAITLCSVGLGGLRDEVKRRLIEVSTATAGPLKQH